MSMSDPSLKPCPSCGYQYPETANRKNRYGCRHYFIICSKCGMRGPRRRNLTVEEAGAAWNSLPRRLRWTQEPPKVAGLYLCREHERKEIRLYRLHQEDVDFYAEYSSGEWAGPIPEPQEAADAR
ncbi:MAG: hypothetical protein HDR50_06625 [Desulfovibrio sp.]|uniref:hypothetical protein n=1 Tax=Desulfovibrio sp. TaxID=885 RepID=UPI001A6B31F0|nr:hypothetical protein [Desulfovibrio sp.]MBD5417323.1 hypothetical protein [Desulfovibrio sp.]